MLQITIFTGEGKCKSGTCRATPEASAGAESQVEKVWKEERRQGPEVAEHR